LYEQTVFLYSISPDARDIAEIFSKIPVALGFVPKTACRDAPGPTTNGGSDRFFGL
jgi:hypothetical protein